MKIIILIVIIAICFFQRGPVYSDLLNRLDRIMQIFWETFIANHLSTCLSNQLQKCKHVSVFMFHRKGKRVTV